MTDREPLLRESELNYLLIVLVFGLGLAIAGYTGEMAFGLIFIPFGWLLILARWMIDKYRDWKDDSI